MIFMSLKRVIIICSSVLLFILISTVVLTLVLNNKQYTIYVYNEKNEIVMSVNKYYDEHINKYIINISQYVYILINGEVVTRFYISDPYHISYNIFSITYYYQTNTGVVLLEDEKYVKTTIKYNLLKFNWYLISIEEVT